LAGVWLVFLVTVVIPTWQGIFVRNSEIRDLEERLATMDEWTVAGMWLSQSVKEREQQVNAVFGRLFPEQRLRGKLFLDLARVADQSGVEGFDLSEATNNGMSGNDVWGDGSSVGPGSGDDGMNPDTANDQILAELATYRVQAHFRGDYHRIARFMGGLQDIERALKVHSLVIRPDKDGIQVDLELDIYVNQAG